MAERIGGMPQEHDSERSRVAVSPVANIAKRHQVRGAAEWT